MFGLTQLRNQLSNVVNATFSDTAKQFLFNNVPNYAYIERGLQGILARTNAKLMHSPNAATTSANDINRILYTLKTDIVGTSNPISFMWKFLQSMVGMRRRNRIDTALGTLKEYSTMNSSPRFVNNTLEKILALIHKRINRVETIWSKLGISTTKAVLEDKTMQGLVEAFKTWIQVFLNLINGGVPGQGISINDIRFLQDLENQVVYGSHAKYLKTNLAPAVTEALSRAREAVYKVNPNIAVSQGLMQQSPTLNPQQGARGRASMPQQLARANAI